MAAQETVYRLSVSSKKGTQKDNVNSVTLEEDHGIVGDAHAGSERQVSLLAYEAYERFLASHDDIEDISPGDFADNITTYGLKYDDVKVGAMIHIGETALLEVTELGKSECHFGCPIRQSIGDCIMPREGIFARVVAGGQIKTGDTIRWG